MSNTDPTTGDYTFDHLDNEQLMTAINEFRKEAVRLVEQGRSLLEALFIHNTDPEAHIDLRTAIAQLERKLGDDITEHNVDEHSHPFLITRCNELAAAIQKLRDDMIPAINSAVLTHNIDPDSHSEAMHKHDTDPNAHRNIIGELQDFLANHNVDPDAHANLFEYLKTADVFRYSRIGEIMPGHLMGAYGGGMFIPADGRYVDVTMYPELKSKIDNGHLFISLWNDSIAASHPGIWMRHKDHHHMFRAPNFSPDIGNIGRFMRFSTNPGLTGLAESDTIPELYGRIGSGHPSVDVATGVFARIGSVWNVWNITWGAPIHTRDFRASRATTTSSETRPKSIYQYPIIYLGSMGS